MLEDFGLYFDIRWRDLGDMFWLMEVVNRGVRMGVLRRFTSAFTETGENMNLKPNACREREEKARMVPAWVNRLEPAIVGYHRWRMLAGGDYFQKPFDYSLCKASPGSASCITWAGRPRLPAGTVLMFVVPLGFSFCQIHMILVLTENQVCGANEESALIVLIFEI